MPLSKAEQFLTAFHDTHPGLTDRAYGAVPVRGQEEMWPSSYALLASCVPVSTIPLRVLDVGCGGGYLLAQLAAREQSRLSLTGLDISAAELAVARTRLGSKAILLQGRAQAMEFTAQRFDVVLSHMALMLMDDAQEVVRELHRVLKPGGRFAAIVGGIAPISAARSAYLDALRSEPRLAQYAGVQLGDPRWRDRQGIAELLAPCFTDVAIDDVHLSQQCTPEAMWTWFTFMYDLSLRDEDARERIKRAYFARVAAHVDVDGNVAHVESLRLVRAIRSCPSV